MKKTYVAPEVKFLKFDAQDILTSSSLIPGGSISPSIPGESETAEETHNELPDLAPED